MAKITDSMIGQIIQAIGGRDNITNCGHCMTRLRLSLADSLHADRDTIKRIAGVMGVIESDNQFQIVLGPGKAQTACEMMNGMLSADAGILTAPPPAISGSWRHRRRQQTGAEAETEQCGAPLPGQVCHHFHTADSRFYRCGSAARLRHSDRANPAAGRTADRGACWPNLSAT